MTERGIRMKIKDIIALFSAPLAILPSDQLFSEYPKHYGIVVHSVSSNVNAVGPFTRQLC